MTTVNSQTELSAWGGNTNLTFGSDFTITGTWTPLNINASVTINGNFHTITTSITSFSGLFFIPINSTYTTTIQKINIVYNSGSSIANFCGSIVGNCVNSATFYTLSINMCSATGAGTDNYIGTTGGGIAGRYLSNTTIYKCVAKNLIGGNYSGGIIGGYSYSTTTIDTCCSNCILGSYGGGIAGAAALGTVVRCYSTGSIDKTGSGGIVGYNSLATIKNCYSTGNISGNNSGGIVGQGATGGTVTNCYVYGAVSGSGFGLITGYNCTNSIITNCHTLYTGSYIGSSSSATITNCVQGNGTWNTTTAMSGLVNTLSTDTYIWSDTNHASPPVLNAPFLLTVFTQTPFNNTSFTQITAVCMAGTTLILMGDMTTKQLQDIERGDIVLEDLKTKKTNTVARLYKSFCPVLCYKIPKNLIGNSDDLIISPGHLVWCNSGKNRIRARDIRKIKKTPIYIIVYNIQFEDDASFYAHGVKVDSLPPFSDVSKLPLELYFDKTKYREYTYTSEDDETRNKPPLVTHAHNFKKMTRKNNNKDQYQLNLTQVDSS